jgi:hypothetical protein
MFRAILAERVATKDAFRWRGDQPSRIESLSDAVFGFVITLLVLSSAVPRSYPELIHLMRGVPSFACSFAVLGQLWWRHCLFFRRFGLHDRATAVLNAMLLCVVVVYAYPLKFFFDLCFGLMLDRGQWAGLLSTVDATRGLITTYGCGLGAVFLFFGLLHVHAYRLRGELALSERETKETLGVVLDNAAGIVAVGLMLVLARVLREEWVFMSQLALFLMIATRAVSRRLLGLR